MLEGELILPLSSLNRARRSLVEQLDNHQKDKAPDKSQPTLSLTDLLPSPTENNESNTQLSVLCRHPHQIEASLELGVERIYVDFEDISRYKEAVEIVRSASSKATIHLATPRIQKPRELSYFKLIEKCKPDGVLIRNLGAVTYFKEKDFERTGDFSLNCTNPITANILQKEALLETLTVSYDLNVSQVIELLESSPADLFEITIHQHMPMFHMEHCVFCTFLSDGKDFRDCGRPCEKHKVQMRDRVGQLHTLMADVGCRNTLFNGRAQTGARFYNDLHASGARKFRCDFTNEDQTSTTLTLQAYQSLLSGKTDGTELWKDLGLIDRLGVIEGTLSVL